MYPSSTRSATRKAPRRPIAGAIERPQGSMMPPSTKIVMPVV
jgi:hypothetical protein